MPTLLHIDSSPSGPASITRRLTKEFVDTWRKANPDGQVITRDLSAMQGKIDREMFLQPHIEAIQLGAQ